MGGSVRLSPGASLIPTGDVVDPMANWRCENCGKVHRGNPSKCRSCGHTVLQQHHGEAGGGRRKLLYALVALVAAVLLLFVVAPGVVP